MNGDTGWVGSPITERWTVLAAFAVLGSFWLACAASDGTPGEPLFHLDHAPDILVEADELLLHPTLDGNRFLAGWWPTQQEERIVHAAEDGARLELVHLDPRPRSLFLDLADPVNGGTVDVKVAGRDLGSVALDDPLEIPLPADLPLGRVLVELAPSPSMAVKGAALRPVLPPGQASFEGTDLVQNGHSRVDVVRRVAPSTRLRGRFQAPERPLENQRFAIEVERRTGDIQRVFEWRPGRFAFLRTGRRFDIPLPLGGFKGKRDWIRLRFVAEGNGPPAHWHALELTGVEEPAAPPTAAAATAERPDLVILYVMDALRADTLGHLGDPRGKILPGVSPVADRLARQGFTFKAHRSLAPNTLPSTKALLTGEAWVDRGGWKLPADGPPTLAERWRGAGFKTALFSGNVYVGASYGVDRGFDEVVEIEAREHPFNDNARRLHGAAMEWLRGLPPEAPAFLYFHTIHPHNPYAPPPVLSRRFTDGIESTIRGDTRTLLAVERRRRDTTPADRERLRRLYAASLAYNDRELGRFLKDVERLFPGRRIFLVLTSDHGEELFDHGGVLHGYTLYEEMLRIPLVVWSPGWVKRGSWDGPTSSLDLHATLAELAAPGRAAPRAERPREGASLLPLLLGKRPPRDRVHLAAAASVQGGIFSVQSATWKLIWAPRTGTRWGQGGRLGRTRSQEYLFHLADDPGETVNRAGEDHLEVAWLRSRLRAWIARKASRDGDAEEEQDADVRRRLEALGYVD